MQQTENSAQKILKCFFLHLATVTFVQCSSNAACSTTVNRNVNIFISKRYEI